MSRPQVPDIVQILMESAVDAIFLVDPESDRLIDVNPIALRMTGISRPDLLRRSPSSLFRLSPPQTDDHPPQRAWLVNAFQQNRIVPARFDGYLQTERETGWLPVHITFTRLPFEPRPFGIAAVIERHRDSIAGDIDSELRALMGVFPEPVWSAEREPVDSSYLVGWKYRYLSPHIIRVVGHSAEWLLENPGHWQQLIHPDDKQSYFFHLERFLYSGRSVFEHEYRIRWPDDSYRWIEERTQLTRNPEGQPIRVDGIVRDVTDRKETERALFESEERLARIVDTSPNGILLIDMNGRITFMNSAAERILGQSREELLGSNWCELPLIHPISPTLSRDWPAWEPLTQSIYGHEHYLDRADGVRLHLVMNIASMRDENGVMIGLVASFSDITARKAAEEALRTNQERLSRIVEAVADGLLLVDRHQRITFVNEAAERIFARPRKLFSTQCWHELPWEPTAPLTRDTENKAQSFRTDAINQWVLQEGRMLHGQQRVITRPDNGRVIVSSSFVPLQDSRGEIIGMVISCTDITARTQAEDRLRRSEERFRALVEKSSDGILLCDGSGKVVYSSSSTFHILGYDSSGLRGTNAAELIHPDDRPVLAGRAQFILQHHGVAVTEQIRCRHRDGSWRYLELTGCNRLEDPSVQAIVINYRDITERQLAEAALRLSERRYRHLFERNLAGVFRCGLNGEIIDCNDAFARIFGFRSSSDIRGKDESMFYFDLNDRKTKLEKLRERGSLTNLESRRRMNSGQPVWVLENLSLMFEGGQPWLEGTVFDITERKTVEEVLAQQHSLLSGLINSVPDLIFYKDREGKYLGCNAAFEAYSGRSEEELKGRTNAELFTTTLLGTLFSEKEQLVLTAREPQRLEEWLHYPDGRKLLVEMLLTPLADANGELMGLIGIGRDLTERKRLEEQLWQAGKMDAIGQLAGGVAHDFRNLLTVILGNISQSLENLPVGNDLIVEQLHAAKQAAQRAAELTSNLLGFARRTNVNTEPINLNRSVEETVSLLRRTIDPRITLEMRLDPSPWTVEADPSQMNQILMNLCLNARDAMPDGGRLVLETHNVELDETTVQDRLQARPGEFVCISVIDTGSGIPPETLSRIFEPFFTTKGVGKGTGLGLAMVHGLLQLHRGWIEVNSKIGEGTRFDIYLPRTMRQPTIIIIPPTVPQFGKETILLVDDEPMIRQLGQTVLKQFGYSVIVAEDGEEAVEIYATKHSMIDLVVLDLTMPKLSGQDALAQMRIINPSVRVVFASGYSAEQVGMDDSVNVVGFLNKPFFPKDLAVAVRSALDLPANRDPHDHRETAT